MLISGLLFSVAWLIPNHYPPWSSFYNELCAWGALLVLALSLRRKEEGLYLSPLVVFLLSIAFVPLVQWGFGIVFFFGDAFISFLYIVGLVLSIVVGRALAENDLFSDWMAWVFIFGAFVSFFLATCQWLSVDGLGIWLVDLPLNGRPFANLAQPNNLATLFCVGLASLLYLRERGFFCVTTYFMLSTLMLAGVAMTRSRMAIIILLVLFGWILWKRHIIDLKTTPVEVLVGLLSFFGLWFFWPLLSDFLYLSAESSVVRLISAPEDVRFLIWRQLINSLMQHPWFGFGWNQVSVALLSVATDDKKMVFTEHAHNIVIDLLVWNGLLLGGGVILFFYFWFVDRIRGVANLQAWFGLLVSFLLIGHSMFEYPLDYSYFLLPFGLCLGMVDKFSSRDVFSFPSRAINIIAYSGLAVGVWVSVEYALLEADFRHMRFQSSGMEQRTSASLTPDVVLLTALREYIVLARTEVRGGMSVFELVWMHKVSSRYPYLPAIFRYALALGLNNRYEEASLQWIRLKNLYSQAQFEGALQNWSELQVQHQVLSNVVLPE